MQNEKSNNNKNNNSINSQVFGLILQITTSKEKEVWNDIHPWNTDFCSVFHTAETNFFCPLIIIYLNTLNSLPYTKKCCMFFPMKVIYHEESQVLQKFSIKIHI